MDRLEHAQRLARSAGAVLMEYYERLDGFRTKKGDTDLVTAADLASEQHLVTALRAAWPDDAILAEEGSGTGGSSGWTWVIDPLDGTTNFVHGFPFFMVVVGLLRDGSPEAGVCFGPVLDELYVADRGAGARRNGLPIRVSVIDRLDRSLLATGFPYDRGARADALLRPVKRALETSHGLRRCGAAAYDQCLLASGRLDGYFEQGLSPWDVAAGSVIVEEAGGRVTDYDGAAFRIDGPNILASNGRIHDALRTDVLGR